MKNNPYIGPRPYRRGEGNFFGRSREARSLAALIMTNQVLLYYACSGAGKTSLLNASVIPELEKNGYYVLPVVRVGSDLPPGIRSEQVNNVFAFSALLDLAGESDPLQPLLTSNLLAGLQAHLQAHGIDPQAHPPLLIFDQFEELLTTHRARWEDARGFFIQVRQALEALPSLGVVLAMREDHVAGLDPYAPLLPGRLRGRFRMELMEAPGALDAVKGPAAAQGVAYAEGVASRLVDDLRRIKIQKGEYDLTPDQATEAIGQYVELVQLQIVCNRLWANLPDDKTDAIRWEEVERYGDIDKALTGFYEDALKTCQVSENLTGLQPLVTERRLRRWFGEQLITPVGTRGLALQGEKETAGLPNPAVEVLDKLHIIRSDVRAGARWYELSHDRLVEPIRQSNAVWEAQQDQKHPWRTIARQWQAAQSDTLLYRGKELQEAQTWLDTAAPGEVEPYEQEFIQASQQAQQTRLKRQRWYMAGGVVTVAVMIVAVLVAIAMNGLRQEAEQSARIALARQLVARAQVVTKKSDPILNTLLGIEGVRRLENAKVDISDAMQALRTATNLLPRKMVRLYQASDIVDLVFTPDSQTLVTLNHAGEIYVIDKSAAIINQFQHPEAGTRLVISQDGERLASRGRQYIYIWKLPGGQKAQEFQQSCTRQSCTKAAIGMLSSSMAFSADGKRFAAAGDDGIVDIWDVASGVKQASIPHDSVNSVAFSPDDRYMVSAGGARAKLWRVEPDSTVLVSEIDEVEQVVMFSRDGSKIILMGKRLDELQVWNQDLTTRLYSFWSAGWLSAVAVSDDGQYLGYGSGEAGGTYPAIVVDLATGCQAARASHDIQVNAIDFGPPGSNLFLSAGWDGMGRISNIDDAQEIAQIVHKGWIATGALSPDGQWAATAGGGDASLYLWQPQAGIELKSLAIPTSFWAGRAGFLGSSMDTQWLAAVTLDPVTAKQGIVTIQISTGEVKETQVQNHFSLGPQASFHGAIISDSIAFIENGIARVHNLKTDTTLVTITHPMANRVHLSPNNQRLVTVLEDTSYGSTKGPIQGPIQLWEIPSGINKATIVHPGAWQILFNATGSYLLTRGEQETVIWDGMTGAEVMRVTDPDKQRLSATFFPDGERFAILRNGWVEIWHIPDPTMTAKIEFVGDARGDDPIIFNPDGDLVVFNSFDGDLTIRRTDAMDQVWRPIPDRRAATDIAFSPDGQWVAIARGDQFARIWDIASGQMVAEMTHEKSSIYRVYFNHDGSQLLTASAEDGMIRLWAVKPGRQIAEACNRLPRNLTLKEWRDYLGDELYRCTCSDLPPHPSVVDASVPIAEKACPATR